MKNQFGKMSDSCYIKLLADCALDQLIKHFRCVHFELLTHNVM